MNLDQALEIQADKGLNTKVQPLVWVEFKREFLWAKNFQLWEELSEEASKKKRRNNPEDNHRNVIKLIRSSKNLTNLWVTSAEQKRALLEWPTTPEMGVTLQSWTRLKITWESLLACLVEEPKTNLVLNSQNNRLLPRFTSLVSHRMRVRSVVEPHSQLKTFQKFKSEQVLKWTYWIDRVRVLQPTLGRIKNSRLKDHQEV